MVALETLGPSVVASFDVIADVAFFLLGVGIILYALIRATTKNHDPIDLKIDKLGSMKMDFVAFLIVVGIAPLGVGVFFRYRGYESRPRELENNQTSLETRSTSR